MKQEVEVLVSLKSSKNQALKVLSKSLVFIGKKRTLDTYFYDPKRPDLKPQKKGRLMNCLRLRTKDNKSYLTYKKDYFEKDIWIHSDEHETILENSKIMLEIIRYLGLKELIKIDNTKYVFENKKYEVVLEDVKKLGIFLEIESKKNTTKDIKKDKEDIRTFIKSLDLVVDKELNCGKPELMIKKWRKY